MAEAAGLIVGIFPLFNAVVEDIRLIRIANRFEEDFQAQQLKLQLVECRVVRWGKANNMTERQEIPRSPDSTSLNRDDLANRQTARKALKDMHESFERARMKMQRLELAKIEGQESEHQRRRSSLSTRLHLKKAKADSNSNTRKEAITNNDMRLLTEKLNKLSKNWFDISMKKAAWTLYDRNELNGLLNDIRDYTDDLKNLFPGNEAARASLADQEASMAHTEELRTVLKELAEKRRIKDDTLLKAVTELVQRVAECERGDGTVTNGPFSGSQATNTGIYSGNNTNFDHSPVTFGRHSQ